MAENKKSIIDKALLDIELMKESLKNNSEDIFRSMAKDEIKASLTESINEAEFDEEDVDDELEKDTDDVAVADDDALGAGEEGPEMDSDDETSMEDEPESTEDSMEDYGDAEGGLDQVVDMTGAPDDEVISVFKKMGPNDGIEIVSDDEFNIQTPDGEEYTIKLNNGGSSDMEDDAEFEMGMGGDDMEDEVMFEIEMVDDETLEEDIVRGKGHDKYAGGGSLPSGNIEGQKAQKDIDSGDNLDGGFDDDAVKHANAEGPMVMKENDDEMCEEAIDDQGEVVEEQIPVGSAQDKRVPATNAKEAGIVGAGGTLAETQAKYKKLLAEARRLEADNNELKKALIVFRKHLGETALYTKKLSLVTKLFLEHSTTLEEKQEIVGRFDKSKTIEESVELSKTIERELSGKKPIKESFEEKITNTPSSSNSNVLKENSTYVDPSVRRMLELMRKQQ